MTTHPLAEELARLRAFIDSTPDPGPARAEISALFGRKKTAEELDALLDELLTSGEYVTVTHASTGGRPAIRYRRTESTREERNDMTAPTTEDQSDQGSIPVLPAWFIATGIDLDDLPAWSWPEYAHGGRAPHWDAMSVAQQFDSYVGILVNADKVHARLQEDLDNADAGDGMGTARSAASKLALHADRVRKTRTWIRDLAGEIDERQTRLESGFQAQPASPLEKDRQYYRAFLRLLDEHHHAIADNYSNSKVSA